MSGPPGSGAQAKAASGSGQTPAEAGPRTPRSSSATSSSAASPFLRRIAGVFATRITQFGTSLLLSLALAALLGPSGRGQYGVIMLVPGTLYAIATFGLPSSTTFYSGRGRSLRSLRRTTLVVTAAASVWLIAMGLVSLPFLERNLLQVAPDSLLRLILIAIPFQFGFSLMGQILYGRQVIKIYNVVTVAQSIAMLLGVIVFVGILGMGVAGAVGSFLIVTAISAVAGLVELNRVVRADEPDRPSVSYRELLGYGIRLYPAVITSFFNYRADVFLLSWLLASSSQIGLYVVAVSVAEITFYVPDSVSSILFPRVASASREEANRIVTDVSRLTLLATLLVGIAVIPVAFVVFHAVLPRYSGSMPALLVLLPGVVSLSLSKVLAGYLTGLGRALPTGAAAATAVLINIACNLVLIPAWGIVGASASSLISYSCHAAIMLAFSSRTSGQPVAAFVLPRTADVRRLFATSYQFARHLLRSRSSSAV